MARRGDTDPLLLQAVSERLARLLTESPPGADATGHRQPSPPSAGPSDAATAPPGPLPEVLDVDEVPPPRRFGRLHVGVVCLLLLAGLLWAGWTVLRARPVALAVPVTAGAAPPSVVEAATPGQATARAPAGAPTAEARSPAPVGSGPSAGATPAGTAPASVVVHVLGAVRRPGLVTLAAPARVQDAVEAAGGFQRDADPGELNLAQILADGQQVMIGTHRKPDGQVRGSGAGPSVGTAGSPGAAGTSAGGTLDLNSATQVQLEELPGVGPVTAAAIVAWRTEHGRFSRPEELQEVDGIGPKTYAQIAPHVRV